LCQLIIFNLQGGGYSLRKQLGETIRALGIPINLKGYRYLIEGTEMVLKNREILGAVTKELYPAIAKKNNTSWHSVENNPKRLQKNKTRQHSSLLWRK
jgi:hypothetical protein